MITEARRHAAESRLRYDTPFWAGGVYKESSTGRWHLPAPGEFQGCAKIVDKRKRLVPAIARPWQLELDEALEAQRERGLPMRVIILKARKLGMSTWIALKFLQRVTQLPYQAALVVAQDVDTAGKILEMARIAYNNLPPAIELGFSVRPELLGEGKSKNGRQHMIFGEKVVGPRGSSTLGESIFEIDTAGSPDAGRGTSPNMLHLSEVGFWEAEQAQRKMLSLLEALAFAEESICAIESTANGLNHFYRRWISACEGSADPDSGDVYTPIFVPWWRDPECSRAFSTDVGRTHFEETIGDTTKYGELAEDEPMLQELYEVTAEQLLWRRMKVQEQPDKSVQTFNQENPHSAEVAFIGSGRTVFPSVLITKAIRHAEEQQQPVLGTLRGADRQERRSRAGTILVPHTAIWTPAEQMRPGEHELRVWEMPRKAEDAPRTVIDDETRELRPTTEFERREGAYILSADVASGEEDTFTKGDYHSIKVFDHHTRLEVATHRSRMDIHELPLWILLIATFYNEARAAIEVNNQGIAVVSPLQKDYRYRRMYRRRRIDTQKEQRQDKAGWETSKTTKPAMEANLMGLLATDLRGGVRDVVTARQLTTYVVDDKGRHGAQKGEHDDEVLSWMIGQMVMAMTRPPKIGGKRAEVFEAKDPLTGW